MSGGVGGGGRNPPADPISSSGNYRSHFNFHREMFVPPYIPNPEGPSRSIASRGSLYR